MAEYIESKCRDCFNLAPCAAWIKHGTMLYSDFSYSVEGCQYFVAATDVAPVVHAEWVVCGDGENVPWMCSHCGKTTAHKYKVMYGNYCPNCGARMDGE